MLDPGAAEAISLATEDDDSTLLIDEAAGRAKAAELGIEVMGTIGILLLARKSGKIDRLEPLLDELQNGLGFFLSKAFRKRALELAGEV